MNPEYLGPLFVDDEKRQDLLINKTWVTKEGQVISVITMDTSHLYNAIAFIQPLCHELYFRKWKRVLRKELKNRTKKKKHENDEKSRNRV